MVEDTPFLPGLSSVGGKSVEARFDGGRLSSDGGLLLFREVEQRLRVSDRLAGCLRDPRMPEMIAHRLDEIIRFRVLAIVAGYEDGNDCNALRGDPMFKMALDRLPVSGDALCSQSTVSRLENLPRRADLYRMAAALVDLYCDSFAQVPSHITLDLDDTFDRVHGGQQLSLFNAYYDDYGFQPIHIFDASGRLVTSVLRPARRPSGSEIRTLLKRVIGHLRERWPRVRIRLRGDSHYACPEVMDWCEDNAVEYVFGLAGTTTLARHVETLQASTAARHAARRPAEPGGFKLRRYKEFWDGAASWRRVRRIVARVEAGADGVDVRYIVTNLAAGRPVALYERLYCQRGRMENLIKAHKTYLASDRTSCSSACANQFRLFLHGAAYWLVWGLQSAAPKRSFWRVAQVDTIRLRLVKLAARIVELKSRIRIALPTSCPDQAILRLILCRLPRLVC